MSDETSARLELPLIQPGQAQKELSHNEAITQIDMLVQPAVLRAGTDSPPATPERGQCWIIGAAPTGAWAGRPRHIAGWTDGGWRFVAPCEGMSAWVAEVQQIARFSGDTWVIGQVRGTTLVIAGEPVLGARLGAIANAAGGTMIDAEARAAVNAVLGALRTHGLIHA